MKILSASIVVLRQGPDHVSLTTDLPDSQYPFTEGSLTLNFTCGRGLAVPYLKTNFPDVPIVSIVSQLEDTVKFSSPV